MIICKVVGHVWATKKEENLCGLKLMVVQEDGPDKRKKDIFVAADIVGAGIEAYLSALNKIIYEEEME